MGYGEGENSVAHTFFDAGNTRLLCAGGDGGLVKRSVLRGTAMVSKCLIGSNSRHCDGAVTEECVEGYLEAYVCGWWSATGDGGKQEVLL